MKRTLKSMKFGDFEWPHNPRVAETQLTRDVIRHKYPGIDGEELENLGMQSRVLTGSGAFFGKDAYKQYEQLRVLIIFNQVQKLFHPNWGTINAVLVELKATNTTMVNYVEYDFTFIEHKDIQVIKQLPKPASPPPASPGAAKPPAKTPPAPTKTYKVVKGDTLWDISKKYYGNGNQWKKIADANKSKIKDPHWIYPGQVFTIP